MVSQAVGEVILLRKDPQGIKLLEKSREPFMLSGSACLPSVPSVPSGEIGVDGQFSLEGCVEGGLEQYHLKSNERSIPFIFLWKNIKTMDHHYAIIFKIRKEGKTCFLYQHTIGYTIYPTGTWKQGEYVKEYFVLGLPHLNSGEYSIEATFLNLNNKKEAQLSDRNQTVLFRSFRIGQISISNPKPLPEKTNGKKFCKKSAFEKFAKYQTKIFTLP